MPGYLGTEESFRESFSKYFNTNLLKFKDIDLEFSTLQGNKKKSLLTNLIISLDDLLSDLHRKVMPFIMRRDKMTVLSELPPKIIQDHYCTLTPVQVRSLHFNVIITFLPLGIFLQRIRKIRSWTMRE